jgi:uncharacterized protein
MSQPAKAQEPSMEEILASIRRIIADDDSPKPQPAAAAAVAAPRPAAAPPMPPQPAARAPAGMNQHDIDAMLAGQVAQLGAADQQPEDILELTEQMAEQAEAEPPSFQTIDGQSDVFFSDAPAKPEPPQPRASEEMLPAPVGEPAPPGPELMSSTTTAAVDSAFNALAHTVLVQNARTLEDLVREMLRPLLKAWLDDNLPGMVERIVKGEIERVSRGRG